MNESDILDLLTAVFSGVQLHDRLIPELIDLLAESGNEPAFVKLLIARLNQLDYLGIMAPRMAEFENIGSGLFSMHLSGRGFNIRILYSFLPSGVPVLLLSFYERAGKAKTDYSKYLQPALDRFGRFQEV